MTLSARLSGRTPPVASVTGVSKARGGVLSIGLAGVEDPGSCYVAIGDSALPPETYADFGHDIGGVPPFEPGDTAVRYNASDGTYSVVATLIPGLSPFVEGNALYLAVFLGNGAGVPDGAAVPDAVVGPVAVLA